MDYENDEIFNQLEEEVLSETDVCPYVDEELVEYLMFAFQEELSFAKHIDISEYKYRTGVVEVLRFLKSRVAAQKRERS